MRQEMNKSTEKNEPDLFITQYHLFGEAGTDACDCKDWRLETCMLCTDIEQLIDHKLNYIHCLEFDIGVRENLLKWIGWIDERLAQLEKRIG
jgi:hypothetical protein